MTDVWVLSHLNHEEDESSVLAVTTTLEVAQQAAASTWPGHWRELEWVQQANGDWTTYVDRGIRFTAEKFELKS